MSEIRELKKKIRKSFWKQIIIQKRIKSDKPIDIGLHFYVGGCIAGLQSVLDMIKKKRLIKK